MLFKWILHWGLLIIPIWVFGNTYYVAPSGQDTNSGLSLLQAFRTLQKAANTVIAGDSVLVSDSTYIGFDIRTSGTMANPVVFFATSSQVIINRRNSVTADGINIENADWIEVRGFRVINQPRAGIRAVNANHISIRYNTCLNNAKWGIFTGFTDDFLGEYNECAYAVMEHGIYVSNSSDRAIIRNNVIHHNRATGLHFNGDLSQGEDGINHDPIVYNNIIYRNGLGGGASINMDGNQNALIYNNLIYNNYSTGIALYQIDGGTPSTNAKIYHNTIVQDDTSRWCILVVDGSTGATIRNNILINQHSYRGAISIDPASFSGFSSDYNIMTNRITMDDGDSILDSLDWKALGQDIHSFFSPALANLFVNFNAGDLKLAANSKAKNFGISGLNPAILSDLIGTPRPLGPTPDAGAYEASSAALPLRWISTAFRYKNKNIEINGTIAGSDQLKAIELQIWNPIVKQFDRMDIKYVSLQQDVYQLSFLTYARPGLQIYRLVGIDISGESIVSKNISISHNVQSWNFFPNPAKDFIYFEKPDNINGITLTIFDIAGRSIKIINNPNSAINIHDLPVGQYRLILHHGQHHLVDSWFLKQ